MKLTQTEFIKKYCDNSTIDEKKLNELGMFAIPCDCAVKGCNGWAMVTRETIRYHVALYLNIKDSKEIK